MNRPTAISVRKLSKNYRVWKSPEARLQSLLWRSLGQTEKANRSFHDFAALSEISFDVAHGESIGIIGLNGSGKSTLLQIIAGTLSPTSGEVTVDGRVAALLELGAGFNPEFTGRENVYLNAAVLGLTREETDKRFPAIANFADIGEYIDQPVKTYSSGMYVRLGFAVLTQVKPDILIIDEALAVGDFLFQQKCFDVMRKFRREGTTFIFVSHGMGSVLELCDRAMVLHQGRMIYDGHAPKAVAIFEENAVRSRYGGIAAAPAPDTIVNSVARQGGDAAALPKAYSVEPNLPTQSLLDEPGSIHSGKVRLIFARFLDSTFAERLLFRTGDSMVISLGFRIEADLAEPHVGFKIRDKMGRIIFETSSLCIREKIAAVYKNETLIGNFSIRLPLIEGEYSLVVGFSEGSIGDRDYREALYYVQHVRTFTIVPDPTDILWSGICHLQPRLGWSILPKDAPQ